MTDNLFFHCDNLNLMKSILTQIPTGFFVCDREYTVLYINDVYANYLDKTPQEIIGCKITDLFEDSGIPHVILSGRPDYGIARRIERKNDCITIIVNRTPLYDDNGKICGAISMALIDTMEQLRNLTRQMDKIIPKSKSHTPNTDTTLQASYSVNSILGKSDRIHSVKAYLVRYAQTDAPVLILGETGTGKELTASAIHMASHRAEGPYVALNCSAFPRDLVESELFGYASGAFSGANKQGKLGQIRRANGGTLFLDEVGELPLDIQAKLLRILEDKKVSPIGSDTSFYTDFRLVAATNRDLKAMVNEGTFREDLFYRINPLTIHLPPLCERKEDIPILVEKLIASHSPHGHIKCSEAVLEAFHNWPWPGNIRELRNVLIRALSLCNGKTIEIVDLPLEITQDHTQAKQASNLNTFTQQNEASHIIKTLEEHNWNVQKSAKTLGISRANMYEKLKKYNIKRP